MSPQPASPDSTGRLFLNQELTVYFDRAINPLTVTSESIQVLDEAGHPRRGRLEVGSQSVRVVPEPPLEPDLMDGSFQPDREYRLVVSGYPRYFNSIQSNDGGILAERLVLRYRTVSAEPGLEGFPSPLLPVGTGTELFLLRNSADARHVPVGDPRLQLHFTLPVLPTSLAPEAFEILLLKRTEPGEERKAGPVRIQPRDLRIITWPPPVDEYPGCTVELELGARVRSAAGGEQFELEAGDFVYVGLATGPDALVDYRRRPVQMEGAAQFFQLRHGDRLPLLRWPAEAKTHEARTYVGDDSVLPGFEVLRDDTIRPRVRVEAGTGELGLFRPREDVLLDPDRPFVRSDGMQVRIEGRTYPFLAVDIPPGVTVTVSGEDVRILSRGSIRIRGVLRISGATTEVGFKTGDTIPPSTLLAESAVALVAAGDIAVSGEIASVRRAIGESSPQTRNSPVTLLAGGRIELMGPIPSHAVLAVEPGQPGIPRTIGPAQQPVTVVTSMTPGVPAGTRVAVTGWTDWQRLRPGSSTVLQVRMRGEQSIEALYQTALPDPVRSGEPDLRPAALPPPRVASDGSVLQVPDGGFLRFLLQADVSGGTPLPRMQELSIVGQ